MHVKIVNLVTGIVFPAQISEDGSCIVLAEITDSFPTFKEDCGYSVRKGKANDDWAKVFWNSGKRPAQTSRIVLPCYAVNVDKIMTNQKWLNDLHTYTCSHISNPNLCKFIL